MSAPVDAWVYGWDRTPAIVSVWADRRGHAIVWRRQHGATVTERCRFRPWLFTCDGPIVTALRDRALPGLTFEALQPAGATHNLLISAPTGQDPLVLLQQTARRIGANPATLPLLQVGPVEQYLMQSGRVSFREMVFGDLRRLQCDLETTDLDPQRGRILLIAVHDSSGFSTVLEAPRPEDEAGLLRRFCALVAERDPDVIENHNLFGFDLPFLIARAAQLGVPLLLGRRGAPQTVTEVPEGGSSRRVRYSVAGREMLDTLDAVRRADFTDRRMTGYGLKEAARAFGVSDDDRVILAGARIAEIYAADPDLVRRYALSDVREVCRLSAIVHQAAFAVAQLAPRRFERVAWAGPAMGILEPMLIRAYLFSRCAPPLPPQLRGDAGGQHRGGATELFAAGLARNVVKADIASLYPSLMVSEQIGPRCDTLGALIAIVRELREARLAHKAEARRTDIAEAEQSRHAALSAAMKLIINSAYGYMGAGRMALFADSRAADRVTERGREVLAQLIAAFSANGVVLLEADTDGVFAALPQNWDHAAARRLIATVGRRLPPGIVLELEGHYAAMYSHQTKNYALLGFDGRVILRGVAFRSRRSEPFAEQFLREAVTALMDDQPAQLLARFHQTLDDLRTHRLTPADVAVTARLRKSPADYAAAGQREGPYEALLNAGRRDWQSGERIRYYVAADGRYTLLEGPGGRYHTDHYERLLRETIFSRLRHAFSAEDYTRLTRPGGQLGLFDGPAGDLQLHWIAAPAAPPPDSEDFVASNS